MNSKATGNIGCKEFSQSIDTFLRFFVCRRNKCLKCVVTYRDYFSLENIVSVLFEKKKISEEVTKKVFLG